MGDIRSPEEILSQMRELVISREETIRTGAPSEFYDPNLHIDTDETVSSHRSK
jgi:hypothetical protein